MARIMEADLRKIEANLSGWAKGTKKEIKQQARTEKMHQQSETRMNEISKEIDQIAKSRDFWALATSNKVTPEGADRLWRLFDIFRQAEKWRIRLVAIKKSAKALAVFERQWQQVLQRLPWGSLAALGGPWERDASPLDWEFLEWWINCLKELEPYREISVRGTESDVDAETREEALGVRWLLELATDGRGAKPASILRFRNCELDRCGKLFWTAAPHQRFCSNACRVAFFASKPDSKKARAERVRLKRGVDRLKDRYYEKHKELPPMATIRKWERELQAGKDTIQ